MKFQDILTPPKTVSSGRRLSHGQGLILVISVSSFWQNPHKNLSLNCILCNYFLGKTLPNVIVGVLIIIFLWFLFVERKYYIRQYLFLFQLISHYMANRSWASLSLLSMPILSLTCHSKASWASVSSAMLKRADTLLWLTLPNTLPLGSSYCKKAPVICAFSA